MCSDIKCNLFGGASQFGSFNEPNGIMGFHYGMIMSTGNVVDAVGPNNTGATSTPLQGSGDATLDAIVTPLISNDAAVIEFDFIANADTIFGTDFVFGSEEYMEFANTSFNDVFGFFISGPGFAGVQNIAFIPGTNTAVSINNLNAYNNPVYYIDNGTGDPNATNNNSIFQYDGMTTSIPIRQAIVPGTSYHFKIAIADVGDEAYDSGVFIRKGSFCGNTQFMVAQFDAFGASEDAVQFVSPTISADSYLWDFGDGSTSTEQNPLHTFADTATYNVTLSTTNICKTSTVIKPVSLNTVGIQTAKSPIKFLLYPVSSHNYKIEFNNWLNQAATLFITDMQGKQVASFDLGSESKTKKTLDFSEIPLGVYAAKLSMGNYSKAVKFVK